MGFNSVFKGLNMKIIFL